MSEQQQGRDSVREESVEQAQSSPVQCQLDLHE